MNEEKESKLKFTIAMLQHALKTSNTKLAYNLNTNELMICDLETGYISSVDLEQVNYYK